MGKYEELIEKVERFFEENRAKEAEILLVSELDISRKEKDFEYELQILNELIGYYRMTSSKDQLLLVMSDSISLCEKMGIADLDMGNISYATTLLNVANGYRSIGDLENSEHFYKIVLDIYKNGLSNNDMLFAGLYNNMSLLYQEKEEYSDALEYQLKALEIVENNNAGFEIAVTYANLSNTAFALALKEGKPFDTAKEYAREAIKCFESRNTIDPHYASALSSLGMCLYEEKDYASALSLFQKGLDIIDKNVGKNSQYYRLLENKKLCEDKVMNGLKLSKLYYEECVSKMIEESFSDYKSLIAVGLVGEGSDCFGFDDTQSMDHDWGPDVCLWLSDETYEKIGDKLAKAYDELPKEFMGYKRRQTSRGKNRRGVRTVTSFYKNLLGDENILFTDGEVKISWKSVPEYALAAAVNGEVFADDEGIFSRIREVIKQGYPEEIRYLKIAEDVANISQTGQYNYSRMIKRNDRITADNMLCECIKHIFRLEHHTDNRFAPHDKWLRKSFEEICTVSELGLWVSRLHDTLKMEDDTALKSAEICMERVGEIFAGKLYAMNIISDINTYLDYHSDELVRKSGYAKLNDQELVDLIAKTEFKAFDKVQNEGGRASCQNNWPTFSVMRKSQYLTWNRDMLIQYIYDFDREFEIGHNLITEKYGRMMESTAPEQYRAIADNFPDISEQKKAVIEQVVALQMNMADEFEAEYPKLSGNARSFHSYEDNYMNTSYETYLRGEISTYSDKMLQLYAAYVIGYVKRGGNIAKDTITNTARLYGYDSLESFEKSV